MDILPSRPGSEIDLSYATAALLFSESNTRFVVEITPDNVEQFKSTMGDIDTQQLGKVISEPLLTIEIGDITVIQSDLMTLKTAWQGTLNWK
jgi:phosphoribosylformylglycinamidine synthase